MPVVFFLFVLGNSIEERPCLNLAFENQLGWQAIMIKFKKRTQSSYYSPLLGTDIQVKGSSMDGLINARINLHLWIQSAQRPRAPFVGVQWRWVATVEKRKGAHKGSRPPIICTLNRNCGFYMYPYIINNNGTVLKMALLTSHRIWKYNFFTK